VKKRSRRGEEDEGESGGETFPSRLLAKVAYCPPKSSAIGGRDSIFLGIFTD